MPLATIRHTTIQYRGIEIKWFGNRGQALVSGQWIESKFLSELKRGIDRRLEEKIRNRASDPSCSGGMETNNL